METHGDIPMLIPENEIQKLGYYDSPRNYVFLSPIKICRNENKNILCMLCVGAHAIIIFSLAIDSIICILTYVLCVLYACYDINIVMDLKNTSTCGSQRRSCSLHSKLNAKKMDYFPYFP